LHIKGGEERASTQLIIVINHDRNSPRQNKRCARPISKAYIKKVLKRCNMHECSATPGPFMKGDKCGTFQSPMNQLEIDQIKSIPYASVVGSIMYAQVCTRPDLAFFTGLLDRF
jgi:hypothetical protein